MNVYVPSHEFTKAVLEAMLAPVPYFAGLAIKAVPTSLKEGAISLALSQVVPLSFGSIAPTRAKERASRSLRTAN